MACLTRCQAPPPPLPLAPPRTPCPSSPAPACRRLVLMRHAESEAAGRVRDHDREITEAGAETALQVRWLPCPARAAAAATPAAAGHCCCPPCSDPSPCYRCPSQRCLSLRRWRSSCRRRGGCPK